MSEGLNDFERSLRRLQPAAPPAGPMLFAMGRASAVRSVRIWRGVSLVSVAAALSLGGMLLYRPEPEVRIVIVPVPAFHEAKPSSEPAEFGDAIASTDSPIPEWRLQHQHVGLRSETLSDPTDAGSSGRVEESRPLRVGDFLKGPLVWSTISTVGER